MEHKEYEDLGILLSIKPHLENDAIIQVLFSKNIISLYAKGIQKGTSKNRLNLQLLSLINFEIISSKNPNGLSTLKRATLIKAFPYSEHLQENFKTIGHFLKKQTPNNNLEILISAYKQILDNIESSPIHCISYFLLKIAEINGLRPIFHKCVECNNVDNIIDFEFYKGGFLCSKHSQYSKNIELLRSLYWLSRDLKSFIIESKEPKVLKIKIMLLEFLKNII
ncbi:DNA repair protein RecO [Mycoplasma enhydrae]|uniref:DNA repair protein RecO n=1 Tax=Mycoplasma enhydrae TaxID=2499220 RepID=UPI0021E79F13|nr:DNA repair protein RecO [Mycoplasma enhydrae]MCV3733905.1 DNA repair protein RecO [Mycoplasma enhydrae]